MPKRTRRGLVPEIQIATGASHDGAPLHTRIYRQLREHILSGALRPGARIPSGRTLAADLGVSRNTVESALDQLVAEGFVVRRVGAGTEVAASLSEVAPFPIPRPQPSGRPPRGSPPAPARPRLAARGALLARLGAIELAVDGRSEPFATHIEGFPRLHWARLMTRRARRDGTALLGTTPPRGLTELCRQISEYAALARGLRCTPEQVVIVNSTQQALDLAARVLLDPGDDALMEDPGYPGARAAFRAAGARVRPVPVDDDGARVDRLPETRARRLLYLTPSHQFPLGVTLSLARRLALLAWAGRTGAWIVEDDYDSEFRSDGRPLAALQALDTGGRVLYVGTCNKVLFPGLRLAYLILPASLVDAMTAARRMTDGGSAPLAQATLAEFMASGQFAAYLRQARLHYAARRALLLEHAASWGPAVRLGPSVTGLHVVVHLPAGTNDVAVAAAVRQPGLGVSPLSRYYAGTRARRGLLLFYGSASEPAIVAAAQAIRDRFPRPGIGEPRGAQRRRRRAG